MAEVTLRQKCRSRSSVILTVSLSANALFRDGTVLDKHQARAIAVALQKIDERNGELVLRAV